MIDFLEGFYHPAEWHEQESIWLSWPHNPDTWPAEVIHQAQAEYAGFIAAISNHQKVNINVNDEETIQLIQSLLKKTNYNENFVVYHLHPTNDSWIRDHGPDFIINPITKQKLVLDWGYNAWGGKYPPYEDDNEIPTLVAEALELPQLSIDMILEGGSVDFNGKGVVLTTSECLLNPNRNPDLSQADIEKILKTYYGCHTVIWLKGELTGDDTDGHIDNIARFVNEDTILCAWEDDENNSNSACLSWNYNYLKQNHPEFNLIKLPMPSQYELNGLVLPCSYANFLIINETVLVPQYGSDKDKVALEIISNCFPERKTIGLSAKYLIWGQGSFHCLSKQEPKI